MADPDLCHNPVYLHAHIGTGRRDEVTMRTVLAIDEMLAHAVKRKLPGEVVAVDHAEMHELGLQKAVERVRELVIAKRSVLVIGGRAWNEPVAFLRDLRLQPFVPVVLLLAAGQEPPVLAWRPRIFAVVPTTGGAQLAKTVAKQCEDAWAYARQSLKPVATRVVARNEPRRAPGRAPGKVLPLDRSGG